MRNPASAVLLSCLIAFQVCAEPLSPMLANVYHDGDVIDLTEYRVSEKFDGVRALWDGGRLVTRQGNTLHAPEWFTRGWPETALDGELWAGRGQFETASGVVRHDLPDDDAWHLIRYEVFDSPSLPGSFDQRLAALRPLVASIGQAWVVAVEQTRVSSAAELREQLDRIVASGGEGLMLHRGASPYQGGRSDDLLKFKPYDDAEATVVAHLPGAGKYTGMLGALLVEMPGGRRFRIGSGLSDEVRSHPPAVGSVVTYTYSGMTRKGVPRFARFRRVRQDSPKPGPLVADLPGG